MDKRIRQIHRWISPVFTAALLVNLVAVIRGKYVNWEGLSAVGLLVVLLLTGLYLFVLPYMAKWRSRRRVAG